MPPLEFPRTMTKGLLKGRRFDSQREYMEALAVAQRAKQRDNEHHFELTSVALTPETLSSYDVVILLPAPSGFASAAIL